MNCRFCGQPLTETFVDLGMSPLSNKFIKIQNVNLMERFYPLHAFVCEKCFLVQLGEFESPEEIFSDYVYFSSYSSSWLEHAKHYVDQLLPQLPADPFVIEIASNDGYLLQYFKELGVEVLGIEPAKNVAEVAISKGIPTISKFFGTKTADELLKEGPKPDLMVANNVLAHVPDINDFLQGFKTILNDNGILTFEFPHLLNLIKYRQFDTIYHEHFSYLSLHTVMQMLSAHGLKVFSVEQLSTHGGSLRVYVTHCENISRQQEESVAQVLEQEKQANMDEMLGYQSFNSEAQLCKQDLLQTLITLKNQGKTIVAYGAAAKGNTLLNYCGIREDFIDYIVDANPNKQNLFTPGTHIPVYAPEKIAETKPDYILILPWNLKDEIIKQCGGLSPHPFKFIIPIPTVEVVQ